MAACRPPASLQPAKGTLLSPHSEEQAQSASLWQAAAEPDATRTSQASAQEVLADLAAQPEGLAYLAQSPRQQAGNAARNPRASKDAQEVPADAPRFNPVLQGFGDRLASGEAPSGARQRGGLQHFMVRSCAPANRRGPAKCLTGLAELAVLRALVSTAGLGARSPLVLG